MTQPETRIQHAGESSWQPTREEIIWATGFWDGEGCASMMRDHQDVPRRLRLSLSQAKDHDSLLRFHRALGSLGTIRERYRVTRLGKDVHSWVWGCRKQEHVQAIMAMLWPFIGEVKRAQFHHGFSEAHRLTVERADWRSRPRKTR